MTEYQIPMKKYDLTADYVEAIEVTPQYVASLPNAGATLQKFGEQVEILTNGPVAKKTYAVYGEYIVTCKDPNGKLAYFVVSGQAFKGLFDEYFEGQPETEEAPEAQPYDRELRSHDVTNHESSLSSPPPAIHDAPLSSEPPKNETHAQRKHREKEEANKKRIEDLKKNDMGVVEEGARDEEIDAF